MLPLAGDNAARFEAGSDRSVGGGRAQHPVDCQGGWGPAADCQPLAASLCRPWPRRAARQAAAGQAADLYEGHRQADSAAAGLDNLNTHKKNEHWLKAPPNVQFHFTPTSASWLNQVEVWFSILQGQSLSGASFTSLKQLEQHINAYIKAYNDQAQPFVWTKKKVRQRRFKGRRITQL
jgi:DDE superfamily endonuclease